VGESRIGEVFVDFISDDLDAVSDADVSVAGKFFLRPHAADRVVRGAEASFTFSALIFASRSSKSSS